MPYRQEWVSREVFFVHKDIIVYHGYKNNDFDSRSMSWFSLEEDGNEDDDFDYRSIKLNGPIPDSSTMGILKQAIDEGILKDGLDRADVQKAIATH
jgi:hypothetical protein